ncbi:uncharacterized protein LACBIDRAFT_298045 [Laccaria bicolor S238N-H82]|uniref:Predicted protein n=1 Tax=Laccaria bicolor (strain S238N-H82 / ATCC MYA-4686) TaxID=486041 RepID=B0DC48_LACBS|nr:uncharacterized protein LACBIDRAFT_298045 [Laccaria bicolor S238N-H82]EDR07674.1 predicted protein [Laccaria bicolor S238N-H82]|eukprot:XP_001881463.1 predicted protein [Laccaria bicolor S238N-H82]
MLIFSVSFQFFRMSPRRGHKVVRVYSTVTKHFAFCSDGGVGHVAYQLHCTCTVN